MNDGIDIEIKQVKRRIFVANAKSSAGTLLASFGVMGLVGMLEQLLPPSLQFSTVFYYFCIGAGAVIMVYQLYRMLPLFNEMKALLEKQNTA